MLLLSTRSLDSTLPPAKIAPNLSMQPQDSTTKPSPCQYTTGKVLGRGTYATVKEAFDKETGDVYACKIINKHLMRGREYLVRNELDVLNKISRSHPNIVTLEDYFESKHNIYLCFGLCNGGELFDRIGSWSHFYEADAAALVRTILTTLNYIHASGIVHGDLKPENLLFQSKGESTEIMITDFGLSGILDEKMSLLTGVCGTPGYMAPEIFSKKGHSKPVDIWAVGVIAYYMLVGHPPFDRSTARLEQAAILSGDLQFDTAEWAPVSMTARDFVRACLTTDPARRPTAEQALKHAWLSSKTPCFVPDLFDPDGGPTDLLLHLKEMFRVQTKLICASNRHSSVTVPRIPNKCISNPSSHCRSSQGARPDLASELGAPSQ
ncbi:kinase-like domain-containing protein [Favolaschia claudopus]|uniref:Kinase-like domain-containing protein n=1 Tax=Favolaschia claudopus TaxID=2862362 RepID=A0AAW0B7X6_9AGAR